MKIVGVGAKQTLIVQMTIDEMAKICGHESVENLPESCGDWKAIGTWEKGGGWMGAIESNSEFNMAKIFAGVVAIKQNNRDALKTMSKDLIQKGMDIGELVNMLEKSMYPEDFDENGRLKPESEMKKS